MTQAELDERIRLHGLYLDDAVKLDLSSQDLRGLSFRSARLKYANFTRADLADANFIGADLTWTNLTGANFTRADLTDANLTESDLTGAKLTESDLTGAKLTRANFARAVVTGCIGLPDSPVIPNIHQSVYEAASKLCALDIRIWHSCETTHCRSGWVTSLAGEAGKELEKKLGPNTAAAIIYIASDPRLEKIPDWYASDNDALEDMKRLAEKEATLACD